jgi:hypothetical protein
MSYEPTRPMPTGWQSPAYSSPRRRRKRWPIITLVTLIVLLGLAVAGDRIAAAAAENNMADQIQQSGFPVKPHVTIEGFPFLTQLLAHDFKTVVISASDVTEGPLEIASMNATLSGMHINGSYSGATIDTINGTALITFPALASAGGIPSGITLSADASSNNEIKANVNLAGIFSTSVVAQVTRVGAKKINVQVVSAGDVPTSALGNLADFTISVPELPAGVSIQSVSITQQGMVVTITGHDTTLSE